MGTSIGNGDETRMCVQFYTHVLSAKFNHSRNACPACYYYVRVNFLSNFLWGEITTHNALTINFM